ncbi:MAG: dephospho-CoA kinase [bacterium]|nr:dephospho-CoA kinase [bacterium]
MIIGLTGGVATGKSLVSGFLSELGACIIDADMIAREILLPGEETYQKVVEAFGIDITLPGGEVDRKTLGATVFSDPAKRKLLDPLTHPEIIKRMKEEARTALNEDPARLVIFDAPLLIEAGLHNCVEKVVVVFAEVKDQIDRLNKKEGFAEAETLARIQSQLPMEVKVGHADFVIRNTRGIEELKEETKKLYEELADGADGVG